MKVNEIHYRLIDLVEEAGNLDVLETYLQDYYAILTRINERIDRLHEAPAEEVVNDPTALRNFVSKRALEVATEVLSTSREIREQHENSS